MRVHLGHTLGASLSARRANLLPRLSGRPSHPTWRHRSRLQGLARVSNFQLLTCF